MATKKKPVSEVDTRTDEEIWNNDANAFAKMAKEFEAGLRAGAYDTLKITFSERRRKTVEGYETKPGAPKRVPIDVSVTYSGRKPKKEDAV